MILNVLGTLLLPLEDGRSADEHLPICAVVDATFKAWLDQTDDFYAIDGTGDRAKTLLSFETWIQAYKDDNAPLILAEYSHEQALHWLPIDLFTKSKIDDTFKPGGDYDHEIDLG